MQMISIPDLNRFLLTEACAHTRTWLRALRSSPARSMLLRLLKEAEGLIPKIGTTAAVCRKARELAATVEMDGFGVGGNTQFPATLWPKEFSRNPWENSDNWPRMKRETVRLRWERWNLRRDSFHQLTDRVKRILWVIESFDSPNRNGTFFARGDNKEAFRARYNLTQLIVVPDTRNFEDSINLKAVRRATLVEWIHVENDEDAKFDEDALSRIRTAAWAKGIRGVFFAQPPQGSDTEVILRKPASDMRLRHWQPYEVWNPEYHSVSLLEA